MKKGSAATTLRVFQALWGLSTYQMCRRLGICTATYRKWARGETRPSKVYRDSLSKAMGIDEKDLDKDWNKCLNFKSPFIYDEESDDQNT